MAVEDVPVVRINKQLGIQARREGRITAGEFIEKSFGDEQTQVLYEVEMAPQVLDRQTKRWLKKIKENGKMAKYGEKFGGVENVSPALTHITATIFAMNAAGVSDNDAPKITKQVFTKVGKYPIDTSFNPEE